MQRWELAESFSGLGKASGKSVHGDCSFSGHPPCFTSASLNSVIPESPVFSAVPRPLCAGNTLFLTAVLSPGFSLHLDCRLRIDPVPGTP